MDWHEFLVYWVLIFTVPKLIIIPLVKWMWDAMKATARQDELDAQWLQDYEGMHGWGGDDGNGGGSVVRRQFHPSRNPRLRPRRPGGLGPGRHARRARRRGRGPQRVGR
jgi:hypothetical protein